MRIAIIGSRNITVKVADIGRHIEGVEEIVSGGAEGVDSYAAEYAREHGIKLTVFLPEYQRYGRAAPIVRNKQIVDYADKIVAFWEKFVIQLIIKQKIQEKSLKKERFQLQSLLALCQSPLRAFPNKNAQATVLKERHSQT
ncbi:MAG: DUF2493 domain-containing protein [Clostridia bacterium]|nr:DUF2493 domain-containing protein [Clostridia bacterium]